MTSHQATLFAYLAEVLITQVPNATIYDFRNMLDPKRGKDYERYWQQASPEVRDYFETEYFSTGRANETAQQVLTMLRSLLPSRAFVNMFASPISKIDLLSEMNEG